MKKFLCFLFISVFTLTSASIPAHSAAKIGDSCKSIGQTTTINGVALTCKKSGSKLLWGKSAKVDSYDETFAKELLAKAKKDAAKILADAKWIADQISTAPNCTTSTSRVSAIAVQDQNKGVLIFTNSAACELVVRASASFLCSDGRGPLKPSNIVRSTGTFPMKPQEEIYVSADFLRYFPQVLTDCRLLTGYASSSINVDTFYQSPDVLVLSSRYLGVFIQAEATKKAEQLIKSSQVRAEKMITDAKNPLLIAKAWRAAAAEKAAAEKAAAEKAAAEKAAAEKAAAEAEFSKTCLVGVRCKFGNIGPGGGVVFYDAGSQQPWGRYLELAPNGWSGTASDPKVAWCDITNRFVVGNKIAGYSIKIGDGKANTNAIVEDCTSGAAVLARAYTGGGKNDWYLPSGDELNEICKYALSQPTGDPKVSCQKSEMRRGGFEDTTYWASNEWGSILDPSNNERISCANVSGRGAWYQRFNDGSLYSRCDTSKTSILSVRPIRSF